MNRLALFILICVVILSVSGCANQPVFCPELKVNFCPSR